MPTYRCFFLSDEGRLLDVTFRECFDDIDALTWAEQCSRQDLMFKKIEIWLDGLLIGTRQRVVRDA